jgi:hypothetical protein
MNLHRMGMGFVAGLALAAGAAEELAWTANFTGANGAVVAPSVAWNYTNLGVEVAGSVVVPRPDAADQYYCTNDQLFCYVGPCTNNPLVYNKVMAAFNPLSSGTPVYLTLTNGQVEASFDLKSIVANAGNRWGLNQELKLSLSAAPVWADPGPYTNMYSMRITVRPSAGTGASNVLVQGSIMVTNAQHKLLQSVVASNYAAAAMSLKMIVTSDATFAILTNNAVQTIATGCMPAGLMPRVYPFFWQGKFSGEPGVGVVADGNMQIDNVAVAYVPEPAALALAVLALALWPHRRVCCSRGR